VCTLAAKTHVWMFLEVRAQFLMTFETMQVSVTDVHL
jgi:hypothetical protein